MKKQFLIVLLAGITFIITQGCESQEFVSAKMYVQQDELDKAEEFFLKAMELESDKNNAEIPYLLAKEIYAKQRRYEEMNSMLDEALKRNPAQKVGKYTIEELAQNLRQVEWSVEYKRGADLYNAVLQVLGEEPPTDEQRAQIEQAKNHFETAILIWPEEGSTFTNLVFCYRQLGDLEGERAAIDKALVKDPDNGTILLLAGERAWSDDQQDQAIEYYKKAHELLPENVDLMQRLTAAYLDAGNPQAALETLEKAQRSAPREPDVYFNIGAVYASIGNDALEKGQDLYREAVSTETVPVDKLEEAVELFKQAQKAYSESLYFMDNTLALNPDDTAATGAIRELQSTKKILDTLQRSAEEILRQNR
ncbi:MAG: tetratricopeptide repeat protein [Fidelibacterota bacterium]|nr:MAG: tetratricopeptide repeat protein [Candidatus Neomarinimicrobiota bacterium]